MMNAHRRSCTVGALFSISFFAVTLVAQEPVTALNRQLARIDFGVSGVGEFTSNTAGLTYLPQAVSLRPSTTLGALVTLRYVKSPLIGGEFNYGYARYTENYTTTNTAGSPNNASESKLGVQANISEYTFGYIAHAPRFFGVQPFGGAGGGVIAFRPTRGGGLGLTTQGGGAFYYTLGAENLVFGSHFGIRAQFRQLFFAAPDFKANYFRTNQRTITTEPAIGFFLRF